MRYLDFAHGNDRGDRIEFVMVLIDLSGSMKNNDWPPSRKVAAAEANAELVKVKAQHYPDDIVGIVGFGAGAKILHTPVSLRTGADSLVRALKRLPDMGSTNFKAALEMAEACLFGKATSKGTLFGNGISGFFSWLLYEQSASASNFIRDTQAKDGYVRRIILLSDGDYNEGGSPRKRARRIKEAGVVIDCVGIGGSPDDVELKKIREVASCNPDGSIRYCWIGDKQSLIKEYQALAHHIRPVQERLK